MEILRQSFQIKYDYNVYFTTSIFDLNNKTLSDFFRNSDTGYLRKLLFVIDEGVNNAQPDLIKNIKAYFSKYCSISLVHDFIIVPGGEECKNDSKCLYDIMEAIDANGIDRHSYLAAIGGGAVLDLAGYVSAIAHRGIKHIRIPTTVLSQNDSGIGVKNGINAFGKKNFIGTFCPPNAVFNDVNFLQTLSNRIWKSGISEAIKVALIKDAAFFEWIEANQILLSLRDVEATKYLIKRCAELHLLHIGGADPFEKGSSRPLDFGHWSAHKIESLSKYQIMHGEAVAMGIALDTAYSILNGRLEEAKGLRILSLLLKFDFHIDHPLALIHSLQSPLIKGLREFREHLGGNLAITFLKDIGEGEEHSQIDLQLLIKSSEMVAQFAKPYMPLLFQ